MAGKINTLYPAMTNGLFAALEIVATPRITAPRQKLNARHETSQ